MKKYLIALFLLLRCTDPEQAFFYTKDPTEVFYVQGQKENFRARENVLGNFSVSLAGDVRESFDINKKPDTSLASYVQNKSDNVSEDFNVKRGADEDLGTYTQTRGEDEGETFNVTKGKDHELGYYTQNEEVIKTESVREVDIVWVIDNSGSMGTSQKNLADNFSLFIEDFAKKDVDFKMAIITTDSAVNKDTDNKLNSAELKKDKQKFIDDFKKKVNVGIRGSAREKAFEMTKVFLKGNSSWIRSDALLVVIFLSDEEEGGSEASPSAKQPVSDYKDVMVNAKGGNLEDVRAFSICSKKYHCSRFEDLSQDTNGLVKDINDSFTDISKEFSESIVNTLSKLKTVFPLNIVPGDISKVKVEVDDSAVPRDTAETNGWNYDENLNAVEFFGSHVPSDKARIKVVMEGSVPDQICLDGSFDTGKVDSLEVLLDELSVPRDTSLSDGWDYDSSLNCIKFYGSHLPSEGAKIQVVLPGKVSKSFCLDNKIHSDNIARMEVAVDGSVVSRDAGKSDGWDYDDTANCVNFYGSQVPLEGSQVRAYLKGLVNRNICLKKSVPPGKVNSLLVTVGGTDVPRDIGMNDGWDYDMSTDCIKLFGSHLPAAGAQVNVLLPGELPTSYCLENSVDKKEIARIKTLVDGKEVPLDTSESDGWVIDSNARCVRFFGKHIPDDGAKVKIALDGKTDRKVCLSQKVESRRVNTLMVSIDGKKISRDTKKAKGWDYDDNAGCLEFFGSDSPSKGAKVEVVLPGEVPQKVCLGSALDPNQLNKVKVFVGGSIVPHSPTKNNGWNLGAVPGCIEFFGSHALEDKASIKVSFGASTQFCLKRTFDEDDLEEVEVIIGNEYVKRDRSGVKGWDYNEGSRCIELFGEVGLEPGSSVKITEGMTTNFCLNKPLDEDKLKTAIIKVDDKVIEQGEMGEGWDYDSESNCISFFGQQLPDINSKIEVTYTPYYN